MTERPSRTVLVIELDIQRLAGEGNVVATDLERRLALCGGPAERAQVLAHAAEEVRQLSPLLESYVTQARPEERAEREARDASAMESYQEQSREWRHPAQLGGRGPWFTANGR